MLILDYSDHALPAITISKDKRYPIRIHCKHHTGGGVNELRLSLAQAAHLIATLSGAVHDIFGVERLPPTNTIADCLDPDRQDVTSGTTMKGTQHAKDQGRND